LKFSIPELDKILEGGVPYLVEQGYGEKEDIENCEAGGKLPWADYSFNPCKESRKRSSGDFGIWQSLFGNSKSC